MNLLRQPRRRSRTLFARTRTACASGTSPNVRAAVRTDARTGRSRLPVRFTPRLVRRAHPFNSRAHTAAAAKQVTDQTVSAVETTTEKAAATGRSATARARAAK